VRGRRGERGGNAFGGVGVSEGLREGREYLKATGSRLCDIGKICSHDVRKRRGVNREGAGGKKACDRVGKFEIDVERMIPVRAQGT